MLCSPPDLDPVELVKSWLDVFDWVFKLIIGPLYLLKL